MQRMTFMMRALRIMGVYNSLPKIKALVKLFTDVTGSQCYFIITFLPSISKHLQEPQVPKRLLFTSFFFVLTLEVSEYHPQHRTNNISVGCTQNDR